MLRKVFTNPFYMLLTMVAFITYYEIFNYVILASNLGIFFVTIPIYMVYALILSGAVLIAISAHSIVSSVRAKYAGMEGGALSIITSSFGSLIVGCSCYAPILSSILYAMGFGVLQVGDTIAFLGDNQLSFVLVFIAANLIFIYYQLGRITRIGGVATRR